MSVLFESFTTGGWNDSDVIHTLSSSKHRVLVAFAASVGVGIPAPATDVTFGGVSGVEQVNVQSAVDEPGITISIFTYQVPQASSGNVTVVEVGGTNPILTVVEVSGCVATVQTVVENIASDGALLDIDNVLASSLCIDMFSRSGSGAPTILGSQTEILRTGHNDGDNRMDSNWGLSYLAGSGTLSMDWVEGSPGWPRSHAIIEMKALVPGSQILWAV